MKPMSADPRVSKSIEQKVLDLDAHLFLLRSHLNELRNSPSHLKVIAATLRTLVCFSGKVEGLLWRLTEELSVDDGGFLNVPGDLDMDNPLVKDISFMIAPISRGDQPHPAFEPHRVSLKGVIKEAQALVAMGKPITHQYLISAVSQQMGTSHEADKVEPALNQLNSIFINGVEPFVHVLAMDAELTLEVGERVLECAERKLGFVRPHHSQDQGNLSVVVCMNVKQMVSGPTHLFCLGSYVASIEIDCYLTPTGFELLFTKHGSLVMKSVEMFPETLQLGDGVMYVFSYCSRVQQIRTMSDNDENKIVSCNLGWVHASELKSELVENNDFFEWGHFLIFGRLLSSSDVRQLMEPNAGGLFISEEELLSRGAFPK